MKRITLTIALLLGGATAAHAQAPGQTAPGPAPQAPYGPYAQQDDGPGDRVGPRGPRGPGGPGAMRGQRGPRGERGQRMKHRMPPELRRKLVAMFDRDQDGRLDQRERRAAKRFVKRLAMRRHHARQGGGQGRGGF